jgi:hypothetical protein
MDCEAVEQLLIEHAGLIQSNVAKQIEAANFYIQNMTKEAWVDGAGQAYQYNVYERTLPDAEVTFATVETNQGDGQMGTDDNTTNPCLPPVTKISSFGTSLRTVQMQEGAVEGPDLCLTTLRNAWDVRDQLSNIVTRLTNITKWVWSREYQKSYIDGAGNKIVYEPNYSFGQTTWAATPATSKLTWGVLEQIHEQQDFNGGNINPFMRDSEGTAVHAVVGDRWTFQDLKLQDDNVRADLRFSSDADRLAGSPGLTQGRVYRGFVFKTIEFPRRFDFNGAWVERTPFGPKQVTRGQGWDVTTAYANAAYTESVVWHMDAMKVLYWKQLALNASTTFNQYSWAGEFLWRNILDRVCNPDGTTGFWRALFAYAVKYQRPDLAFAVRHLRCRPADDFIGCNPSQ